MSKKLLLLLISLLMCGTACAEWKQNPYTRKRDYYHGNTTNDARYLMLDCSNDPLTAALDGIAYDISDKKITVTAFTDEGINAAIDALGTEGGEVYLPEGEYAIDGPIEIDYNNTTLRGSGWGTYLNADAWSADHVINLNGCDYVTIRDLQIEGNDGGGNAFGLIYDNAAASTNFLFDNLYLHHSDYGGIYIGTTGSQYGKIVNCYVTHCDWPGIITLSSKIIVSNNTVVSNLNTGIYVSTQDGIVRGNTAISNTVGIAIYGAGRNSVAGNTAVSNTQQGMLFNSPNCSYTGNTVVASGRDGIKVLACDNSTIAGNVSVENIGNTYDDFRIENTDYASITGNTTEGIATYNERGFNFINSTYNTLSGNTSETHDTAGIELDVNSTNNHIIWNNLEGEAVATITDGGSNNTIVNATAGVVGLTGTLEIGTVQTYTESNVTTDRTYDANATTTDELADVLGSLIVDLRAMGVIN